MSKDKYYKTLSSKIDTIDLNAMRDWVEKDLSDVDVEDLDTMSTFDIVQYIDLNYPGGLHGWNTNAKKQMSMNESIKTKKMFEQVSKNKFKLVDHVMSMPEPSGNSDDDDVNNIDWDKIMNMLRSPRAKIIRSDDYKQRGHSFPVELVNPKDGKEFSVEEMKEIVKSGGNNSGYIEIKRLGSTYMVLNEEGKLIGLEINSIATSIFEQYGYNDHIVGDVLICSSKQISE